MTPPSDKAVLAAEAAKGNWIKVIDAVHDPALGLDCSVCLRDVVEWLKREAKPSGECGLFPERLVEMCEREFGA